MKLEILQEELKSFQNQLKRKSMIQIKNKLRNLVKRLNLLVKNYSV